MTLHYDIRHNAAVADDDRQPADGGDPAELLLLCPRLMKEAYLTGAAFLASPLPVCPFSQGCLAVMTYDAAHACTHHAADQSVFEARNGVRTIQPPINSIA